MVEANIPYGLRILINSMMHRRTPSTAVREVYLITLCTYESINNFAHKHATNSSKFLGATRCRFCSINNSRISQIFIN